LERKSVRLKTVYVVEIIFFASLFLPYQSHEINDFNKKGRTVNCGLRRKNM